LKILFISPRVPYPPTDGGAIAIYNTVTGAARAGHEVYLLSLNTPKHLQEGPVVPGLVYQEAVFVDTRFSFFKAVKNIITGKLPYIAERFVSEDFSQAIERLLKKNTFDIIQFEGTYVAWYVDVVKKFSNCPLVIRAHNVEYVIWERLAENKTNPIKKFLYNDMVKKLRVLEKDYYNKFDGIASITYDDGERLRALGINKSIKVVPFGVGIEKFLHKEEVPKKPFTIFMLGSLDWRPNQEAAIWFVENIWPELSKAIPQLELHIAGKNTPPKIYKLKQDRVFIHGFIEDSLKFMQEYDLMAVPLLSGGGMRVKIIEGMALHKAIISSAIGAEGIMCEDEKNILLANTKEEWIGKIKNYFKDPERYRNLGNNAGRLVENTYSNQVVTRTFIDFYKQLIIKRKA
jgi:glycosyltransferase involved in cell wall biosynthesis